QVAARHVQADGIAEDVVVGAFGVDAAPALAERHHQLGLVVVIGGLRRVVHFAAAGLERELALQEEERRLAAVAAHLLLVLGVVAADAEDAAHGKLLIGAGDGKRRRGPQGNSVGSHGIPYGSTPSILF